MASPHRLTVLALLFLLPACPTPSEEPDDDDDDDVVVDDDDDATAALEYGTVETCDVARISGFDAFYEAGDAVLVHGNTPQDSALAARVEGWYAPYLSSFALRSADALSDADRALDLFVLGTPSTNPLLAEMNGALPVWFEAEGFTFGGYRWDEPGHGVVMMHPSPFAQGRYVMLYAGNTLDGAWSTFSVPTGAHDYATVRGGRTLQTEGELCRSGDLWGVYGPWTTDLRAQWDAWIEDLEAAETAHHSFRYLPGSRAADDMAWLADWQEERYDAATAALAVEPLDEPIRTYLYPDNDSKEQVTGNGGNGHANSANYEVHEVYGDDVQAVGAHEDVHVIAWHRIGETDFALMGEGLAVMVDGEWWGDPLDYWVAYHRDAGSLPSLPVLIDDFWSVDDGTTYPVAGHFVQFVIDEWGIDTLKDLYVQPDLEAALVAELGLDLSELEALWLASVL